MRPPLLVAAALILANCGGSPDPDADLARLDNELAANAADPARDPQVAQSLGDQITVDPRLVQQSNANAIRPPNRPDTGAVAPVDIAAPEKAPEPAGLASAPDAKGDCPECRARPKALTLEQAAERGPGPASCLQRASYSAAWANQLPAAAPLFPDARVVEAAGVDAPGCAYRIVSYRSSAPWKRVADWYYTKGRAAGYSAGHRADGQVHVIGGTKGDAAFLVYLRPQGAGTDVDVVANGG